MLISSCLETILINYICKFVLCRIILNCTQEKVLFITVLFLLLFVFNQSSDLSFLHFFLFYCVVYIMHIYYIYTYILYICIYIYIYIQDENKRIKSKEYQGQTQSALLKLKYLSICRPFEYHFNITLTSLIQFCYFLGVCSQNCIAIQLATCYMMGNLGQRNLGKKNFYFFHCYYLL